MSLYTGEAVTIEDVLDIINNGTVTIGSTNNQLTVLENGVPRTVTLTSQSIYPRNDGGFGGGY